MVPLPMWVFFLFVFLPVTIRAETFVTTTQESEVRKEALDDADSYGVLPKDTRVKLKGLTDNNYVLIEVELEESKIEGWILQKALVPSTPSKKEEKKAAKPLPKIKPKIYVPPEEAILIRREKLFYYGASAGANYGVLSGVQTDYLGFGFGLHADLGFYLDPSVGLRLESGYFKAAGTDAKDVGIHFGFFDFAAHGSYLLDPFEVYLGLKYALGIGVSEIPSTIVLDRASDLSSIYLVVGGGYDFAFDKVTSFGVRAEYNFSLSRSPVGFQLFWLRAYVHFKG